MKKAFKIFMGLLLAVLLIVIGYCALNFKADIPVAKLKTKYATAASRFMDLAGMSVHYRDEGNAADEVPLVLLHGAPSCLLTWDGWAEALKARHRVIRLDLPGYGLTGSNPENDYSLDFYMRFLSDFLRQLQVGKCVMIGNSMGGRFAWKYAMIHPEQVKKMILIDSAGYPSRQQGVPLAMRLAAMPLVNKIVTYVTPRSLVEKSLKQVYVDKRKVSERLVQQYYDMVCRAGNRMAFVISIRTPYTPENNLIGQIQTPTLIMWGEQDRWIPVANAYRFKNDLPNASLIVYPNLGHVPHEESPAETVKDALKFLQ
jgi:pimeloyl-ACP methyl ester carboxylesterase